jgi:flavin-dependent dehydrogenase
LRDGVRHDVVVVGGGPAGAAAALLLARRGRSVALVQQPPGRGPRLGETVPGDVVTPLVQLDLWERFIEAGHVAAPGTVAAWGSATPSERDALFDPYGCSWHLDRSRFDAMLLGAGADAGVEMYTGTVADCHQDGTDGWRIRSTGPQPATLGAHWVVDASGRAAHVARRQGVQRTRCDRLIGLACSWTTADSVDTRTVIEATETGWWYSAILPKGRAVAILFTDADLLPPRCSVAGAAVGQPAGEDAACQGPLGLPIGRFPPLFGTGLQRLTGLFVWPGLVGDR